MDRQASGSEASAVTYHYTFTRPDGRQHTFVVQLDRTTLQLRAARAAEALPAWTALEHHQCGNCPLKRAESPHCPAAVSLVEVVSAFGGALSYETVEVMIETDARRYLKRTSLQQAVSSLIGLLMVTSGCPVMGKFRPMVRHHLPFADVDETRYRVLSMYLLAQYFLAQHHGEPDWQLDRLVELYESVRTVNSAFAKRLADATAGDANVNALVILDSFADTITFSIDEHLLDELELVFQSHLA